MRPDQPVTLERPRCPTPPNLLKSLHPRSAAEGCGRLEREEPMTSDVLIARRDIIKAAGAGLATGLLAGATAQAQTPAAAAQAGGEFWTAEYTTKKSDVSLQMYRKRIGAPAAGDGKPVLFLVHGSSNAALSSYDLTVPSKSDYSMMNV